MTQNIAYTRLQTISNINVWSIPTRSTRARSTTLGHTYLTHSSRTSSDLVRQCGPWSSLTFFFFCYCSGSPAGDLSHGNCLENFVPHSTVIAALGPNNSFSVQIRDVCSAIGKSKNIHRLQSLMCMLDVDNPNLYPILSLCPLYHPTTLPTQQVSRTRQCLCSFLSCGAYQPATEISTFPVVSHIVI